MVAGIEQEAGMQRGGGVDNDNGIRFSTMHPCNVVDFESVSEEIDLRERNARGHRAVRKSVPRRSCRLSRCVVLVKKGKTRFQGLYNLGSGPYKVDRPVELVARPLWILS